MQRANDNQYEHSPLATGFSGVSWTLLPAGRSTYHAFPASSSRAPPSRQSAARGRPARQVNFGYHVDQKRRTNFMKDSGSH